ncbi:MAG: type II secretion system F family protein [Methylococcaceae bacterium]|nr:type II secretion system F family protein [Methylococcaceae bacterium]
MKDDVLLLFIGSVFLTVFILSQALLLPTLGTNRAERKKLKHRFDKLLHGQGEIHHQLVKKNYLGQLSPAARFIESRAVMMDLKMSLEHAGLTIPAYRFVLLDLIAGITASYLAIEYFHHTLVSVLVFFAVVILPFFWLRRRREKNIEKFDEQLPEALDMIARSLQTGYPFSECLKIVAEEMPAPVGYEFGLVFEDVNYGRDLELALALMIERVPSLSLNAMATSVLIQKETGGNMAEILYKISQVLRGRFKLQRRVKTLSAEGIFSAWVLCLMPFVMFLMLSFLNPGHFDALFESVYGTYLVYVIGILEVIAIFWMRKIIRIDV